MYAETSIIEATLNKKKIQKKKTYTHNNKHSLCVYNKKKKGTDENDRTIETMIILQKIKTAGVEREMLV